MRAHPGLRRGTQVPGVCQIEFRQRDQSCVLAVWSPEAPPSPPRGAESWVLPWRPSLLTAAPRARCVAGPLDPSPADPGNLGVTAQGPAPALPPGGRAVTDPLPSTPVGGSGWPCSTSGPVTPLLGLSCATPLALPAGGCPTTRQPPAAAPAAEPGQASGSHQGAQAAREPRQAYLAGGQPLPCSLHPSVLQLPVRPLQLLVWLPCAPGWRRALATLVRGPGCRGSQAQMPRRAAEPPAALARPRGGHATAPPRVLGRGRGLRGQHLEGTRAVSPGPHQLPCPQRPPEAPGRREQSGPREITVWQEARPTQGRTRTRAATCP